MAVIIVWPHTDPHTPTMGEGGGTLWGPWFAGAQNHTQPSEFNILFAFSREVLRSIIYGFAICTTMLGFLCFCGANKLFSTPTFEWGCEPLARMAYTRYYNGENKGRPSYCTASISLNGGNKKILRTRRDEKDIPKKENKYARVTRNIR